MRKRAGELARARLRFAALVIAGSGMFAACGGGDVVDPPPAAPPPPTYRSAFERVVDSMRNAIDVPALGAAIVTADSVRALAAFGFRRAGGTARVTDDDRFHLGSVLKHQTSVLIARLVAEGRVSWTQPVVQYLPAEAASARSDYATVTLADLVSHTTGVPRDPPGGLSTSTNPRDRRSAVARWALQQAPVVARGSYAYSNAGYMIAAAAIEAVVGRSFEQLMSEQLWLPLGMTRAGFGPAGTPNQEDEPWGHVVNANGVRTAINPGDAGADNPLEYGPAGRAHMSMGDWARFTQALLRAESGRDTPVLSSSGWVALTARPYVTISASDGYAYGMGVTTRSWAGGRTLTHDGSNNKHYAILWVAPLRNVAFLAVANQYDPTIATRMDRVVSRLLVWWQSGS